MIRTLAVVLNASPNVIVTPVNLTRRGVCSYEDNIQNSISSG